MDPVEHALCPREIVLDLDVRRKADLLEAIATVLACSCRMQAQPILRALCRREQAGSTAVGDGLAIPHARIPGIDAPVTMFARTRSPIPFGAPDGKPVAEFFIILVPAEGATEAHLRLLRAVAERFSDRIFRAKLGAAESTATAATVFACRSGAADDEPEALLGIS